MSDYFEIHSRLEKQYIREVLPSLIPGVGEEVAKFVSFNERNLEFSLSVEGNVFAGTPFAPSTETKRFVHFTSLKALQSILNENAIRLYNLKNANDPNEYEYFVKEIDEIQPKIELVKENTFILSLCDEKELHGDNALNLWRLYGDAGRGVAIVFEINMPAWSLKNYYLGKVQYSPPNMEEFLQKNTAFENLNNVKVNLSDITHIPACFYKKGDYKIEKEIRLLFHEDSGSEKAITDYNNWEFRKDINSRNEIVTYYSLKLQQTECYPEIRIDKIYLGFQLSTETVSKIQYHFGNIINALGKSGLWKKTEDLPKIEHFTLLKNSFR